MRAKVAAAAVLTTLAIAATAAPASARPAPRACLRALDRAEVVMDYAVQGFSLTAAAFNAAAELDTAEMSRINDEIVALAPQVRIARDAYDKSASACRGG